MKFENTEVFNFDGAIRGMRNPLESWGKSDSFMCDDFSTVESCHKCPFFDENKEPECLNYHGDAMWIIGNKDLALMRNLIKAGGTHRKFMRQIFVSVDITAPLYWWKEFETYKVGTVANSTSTMHRLASTPITMDCFEMDDFENLDVNTFDISGTLWGWNMFIEFLEELRQEYNKKKDIRYWKELIRLLPESWLQKRTVTMNYENVLNMVRQRKNHKLTEWSESFMKWAKSLPYAQELLFIE